ncbi:hypothetical protein CCYA_CCYA12G3309 [Cyanidiococcus yangmingshanensis]|nr:hypothetical protein CCYA_CCYA12G3309 [Cyanidiococcus yangmingshanensis]
MFTMLASWSGRLRQDLKTTTLVTRRYGRSSRSVRACEPLPERKEKLPTQKAETTKPSSRAAPALNSSDTSDTRKEQSGRGFGPRERKERLEKVLEAYGFEQERAGRELDRLSSDKTREDERLAVRFYSGIRALFGGQDEALYAAEQWLNRLVLVFLVLVLCAGLGIVFEATAASQRWSVSPGIAGFLREKVEPSFTPLLFTFFGLSSMLGIYKAVQIEGDQRARYRE